jgi:hypothetical protein
MQDPLSSRITKRRLYEYSPGTVVISERKFILIVTGMCEKLKNGDSMLKNESKMTAEIKVEVKHHAMKTYWGMEVQLHAIVTSAPDGDE